MNNCKFICLFPQINLCIILLLSSKICFETIFKKTKKNPTTHNWLPVTAIHSTCISLKITVLRRNITKCSLTLNNVDKISYIQTKRKWMLGKLSKLYNASNQSKKKACYTWLIRDEEPLRRTLPPGGTLLILKNTMQPSRGSILLNQVITEFRLPIL